jgi:hypothetical protein
MGQGPGEISGTMRPETGSGDQGKGIGSSITAVGFGVSPPKIGLKMRVDKEKRLTV